MGKLNNSVLILGEGPTEFFYLKSLADTFKHITIKPDYPKHTNLQELEKKIKEGVDVGYSHIFYLVSGANQFKFTLIDNKNLAERTEHTSNNCYFCQTIYRLE